VRSVRSWMVTGFAAAAVLCASAPSALASATLTKAGTHIAYEATPGEVDAIELKSLYAFGTGWYAQMHPIAAHGGATFESPDRSCVGSSTGLNTGCWIWLDHDITFDLGDRDDHLDLGVRTSTAGGTPQLSPKAVVHGGAGVDTVRYLEPVRASLDDLANDGPAGFALDNIGSDVEVLEGSDGDDRLEGGPGANTLLGGGGDDQIHANDQAADVVDCGAGDDLAIVDPIDTTRNCETVGEVGSTAPVPAAPAAPAVPAESAPAPAVAPRVLSGIDDKWDVHARYTKVTRLVVEDVPAGGTVTANGAPARVTGAKASLTKRFKGRRLKPGKAIEIRVTAPGMTPRTVRFTIRAKRLPLKATL
jgi:RTX calcium-binding nonapeptide repeat (4 copies)